MTLNTETLQSGAARTPNVAGSDSILHQLSHTYYELTVAFERHIGMSRARWAILSRLGREGNLTQAVLAQILHVDAAAITTNFALRTRSALSLILNLPQAL